MSNLVKVDQSQETWKQVKDLVINKSELSIKEIAQATSVPLHELEAKIISAGWLNERDKKKTKQTVESLNRIARQVALQLNDVHSHAEALLEALQYSHRVKIVRDNDGTIHYRNMEEFPGRPKNWNDLSPEQKEYWMTYIATSRFTRFMADLMTVLNMKVSNINTISKITKASLPKADPELVDISRKETTLVNEVSIFEVPLEEEVKEEVKEEE